MSTRRVGRVVREKGGYRKNCSKFNIGGEPAGKKRPRRRPLKGEVGRADRIRGRVGKGLRRSCLRGRKNVV